MGMTIPLSAMVAIYLTAGWFVVSCAVMVDDVIDT